MKKKLCILSFILCLVVSSAVYLPADAYQQSARPTARTSIVSFDKCRGRITKISKKLYKAGQAGTKNKKNYSKYSAKQMANNIGKAIGVKGSVVLETMKDHPKKYPKSKYKKLLSSEHTARLIGLKTIEEKTDLTKLVNAGFNTGVLYANKVSSEAYYYDIMAYADSIHEYGGQVFTTSTKYKKPTKYYKTCKKKLKNAKSYRNKLDLYYGF